MGMYLNPDNALLRQDLNSEIFVDKSMIIAEVNKLINTNGKFICVSRPRRFGKTMAGNMISAYYSKGCDSSWLFKNLKIANDKSYETYLNKLNVIQIDLNAIYNNSKGKDVVEIIDKRLRDEFVDEFPQIRFGKKDSLEYCMMKVYAKTGETFVIIIDEYDVLIREKVSDSLFKSYLGFLNGLFKNSTLSRAIFLAYLTGIFPIVCLTRAQSP